MSEPTDTGSFRPSDALNKIFTVDDARTTAKRLAAYRDELREAGFDEDQVRDMIQTAAPLPDDVVIQADVDNEPTSVGEVVVRFVPEIDAEEIERAAKRAHAAATKAVGLQ
ncbi:hypothetical protein [Actinomadura decatromicini]|uniref:Uncharacterized protein n=1 Tax=Actinomadura decatromicini TaxID=2604572 RepID=A0A5D3FBQ3_9ACTN|nr:hypothetical protein [Actinomadura decatromicini]TYK45170.1 hypothetical protein FXF68_31320 [Actinomadura decatromicini]